MSIRKSNKLTRQAGSAVLKRERLAASMSQTELAERLGVSQPLVSSWESGRITMSIEDIVALEKVLKFSKGKLLMPIAFPDDYSQEATQE